MSAKKQDRHELCGRCGGVNGTRSPLCRGCHGDSGKYAARSLKWRKERAARLREYAELHEKHGQIFI